MQLTALGIEEQGFGDGLNSPIPNLQSLFSPLGPFEPQPHFAVAVSGGADSMALTLLAHQFTQQHGGTITALTVNHGLRPEALKEAEGVQAWLQARGIAHHILTPTHHEAGNNLQAAARRWRYDALTAWCRAHDVLHLLVAHHADDQAETSLLMQQRGNTADGVAAMPAVRMVQGVRVLRPLLGVRHAACCAYLQSQQQPWVEDPSNRNQAFKRVQLRDTLQHDEALHHAAIHAVHAAAHTRIAAEKTLATDAYACLTHFSRNEATLNAAMFFALTQERATLLLANTLRSLRSSATRPRHADTLRLYQQLRGGDGKASLHHCDVQRAGAHIHIRTHHALAATPPIPLAASPFWA